MSDSTTPLEQIDGSQAEHEVTANNLIDAASHATAYGRHAEACAGLTWGYYGTRFGGTAVANGTHACDASDDTYMVADLATGAVSFDTATTDWDDAVNFGRCYKITTGVSSVTSYEDHRTGPLGIFAAAAVSGSGDMLLAGVQTVTGAKTFGSAGAVGKLKIAGTTSGSITLDAAAVAGTNVLTLPAQTDTLATLSDIAAAGVATDAIWDAAGDLAVGTGANTAARLPMGSALQVLRVNAGATALEYAAAGAGTVTHTGGALTANAVVLGAGSDDAKVVAGITTDGTSALNLGVAGASVGKVVLANATSGTITVQPPTGALGTVTLTAPATTGTLALLGDLTAGYQPLDADLTTIAALTATTDSFLQSKSSAWASRTVAQVTADLQGTGLLTDAVGIRYIPQNSQSAAYTTVAADSGKSIDHPSTDANARTFTIDSNANVAYPVGTTISFSNMTSQVVTIAITSDTMYLAGTGTTGSRSLAQYGTATARKITSTAWLISGIGLT